MNRLLVFWFAGLFVHAACADDSSSQVETFLHAGDFRTGETVLLLVLDEHPDDDEARFGLGVLQFLRAVEGLGQALHEYGAVSGTSTQPFLRFPVPANKNPATISCREFGRVLDEFATNLRRADATLAKVRDDSVKLKLRLAKLSLDLTGTGKNRTTLLQLIRGFTNREWKGDPDFGVHFDRGDVA